MRKITLIFITVFFIFLKVYPQTKTPYLEKKASINAVNQPISEIFEIITLQTGLQFSYNSAEINDKKKITLKVKNTPTRLVIEDVLKQCEANYKLKKNYILVFAKPKASIQKTEYQQVVSLRGYIYNSKDSSIIENTSIYIKDGRYATLSNEYGFFEIKINKQKNTVTLKIAKDNFQDTTITISGGAPQNLKIYLSNRYISNNQTDNETVLPITTALIDSTPTTVFQQVTDTSQNSFEEKYMKYWGQVKTFKENLKNIKDTLFTKFSFALVPMLSTNKFLSVNTVNDFSLSALVGYSKGTKKAEVAGLANINTGNVQYFQAAGISNIVKGNVKGAQIAGIANIVKGDVRGVQLAGTVNVTAGDINGLQLAGTMNNSSKNFKGFQVAGIINNSKSIKSILKNSHINKNKLEGFQIAGIINLADSLKGFQIAGNVNVATQIEGFQIAGNINSCKNLHGLQLSGLINVVSDTGNGTQVAGIVNYAKILNGAQIGLVNISDSLNGVPIGLFSYSKKGYHKFELSVSEIFNVNFGYKSGVNKFYNTVFTGLNFANDLYLVNFGYGIGGRYAFAKKWYFNPEINLQRSVTFAGNKNIEFTLSKLFTAIEFTPTKKWNIAIGPTLNWAIYNNQTSTKEALTSLFPSTFYNNSTSSKSNALWFGVTGALRF